MRIACCLNSLIAGLVCVTFSKLLFCSINTNIIKRSQIYPCQEIHSPTHPFQQALHGKIESKFIKYQCMDHAQLSDNKSMAELKTLEIKSNESIIYALIGWNRCSQQIQTYENCKKTGTIYHKDPTQCYNQARDLQICYNTKALKVEPICLPIYNDLKECLFQGDTHVLGCKEEINEFTYCQNNPGEYMQFLRASTPQQRLPKAYDFHKYNAKFDYN